MRAAYVDAPWTAGLPGMVNALSHPATGSPFVSVQAAVDYVAALPGRGRVYCPHAPAGRYASSSTPSYSVGLELPEGVRVFGDGFAAPGSSYGTVFDAAGQDPDVDMVTLAGSYTGLEDLALEGPDADGDGRGVVYGPAGDPMRHAWCRRVSINSVASWAVYLHGDPGSNICILSGMRDDCRITNLNTKGAIYVGPGNYVNRFENVNMPVSPQTGYPIVKVEGAFQTTFSGGCTFESTADCVALEFASGGDYARQLTVDDCYFEMHHAAPTEHLFEFTADDGGAIIGANISRNFITRYAEGLNAKVLLARLAGASPHHNIVFDGNNIYENRTDALGLDDILISDVSHDIMLRNNMVWNRTGGVARGLHCSDHTAGVVDWDYKRFMFPRLGADPGSNLQGSAYRNIIGAKTRQFTGAAWQTIQAVTEAAE